MVWNEVIALGLDPMNIRGQGYDGAANISGWRRGVQAIPLTLYVRHSLTPKLLLQIARSTGRFIHHGQDCRCHQNMLHAADCTEMRHFGIKIQNFF